MAKQIAQPKTGALSEYLKSQGIDTTKPFHCLCPDHPDKNPSMSYDPRRDKAHCFACGVTYDLADVLHAAGMDKPSAIRTKNSFYRDKDLGERAFFEKKSCAKKPTSDIIYTGNLSIAASSVQVSEEKLNYWGSRGFTQATINRFGLTVSGGLAVIPFNDEYSITRSIKTKNYFNPKGQPLRLYDPENASGFVFVVEGAIDAISVLQAASDASLNVGAVALNGVTNIAKMAMAARPDSLYCLCLDNDAAGREAQQKLTALFDKRNIEYIELNIYGAYKDANERLLADPDGLARALADAVGAGGRAFLKKSCAKNLGLNDERSGTQDVQDTQFVRTEQHVQEVQQLQCAQYTQDNNGEKVLGFSRELSLERGLGRSPKKPLLPSNLSILDSLFADSDERFIPTGFDALDGMFCGGLPLGGLTILGAPSGAGKTTLCLNIADNVAATGRDVLFFSLEMPRRELMCKSLSRETLRVSPKLAVPYSEILSRSADQVVKAACEAYSKYAGNIYMLEPDMPSPESISDEVEAHISALGDSRDKPLVIVDYLQLLAPRDAYERSRLSEKQALDRSVGVLRRLCRAHGVSVLAISSLNRAGYSNITMEAFKESGSIEYSSDLLLSLTARGKDAEVMVLKNRYGAAGVKSGLRFYAEYGVFV